MLDAGMHHEPRDDLFYLMPAESLAIAEWEFADTATDFRALSLLHWMYMLDPDKFKHTRPVVNYAR